MAIHGLEDFMELAEKNRSYRGFDASYRFTREHLLQYIECVRLCPSTKNMQALKYVIAYETEDLKNIEAQIHFATALPYHLPFPGKEPTGYIVICQDLEISDHDKLFLKDAGAAAQTILLAAVSEGLGGCMVGNFGAASLAKTLGLAEQYRPLLVLALGRPEEKVVLTDIGEDGDTTYYRKDEDKNTHYVPKRSVDELVIG